MVTKMISKIRNFYKDLIRPLRNLLLKQYMEKAVVVFRDIPTCEHGGIFIAVDYSGLDNTLRVYPADGEDSEFKVPIYVKPHEVLVYSLDKKEMSKLIIVNLVAKLLGRI